MDDRATPVPARPADKEHMRERLIRELSSEFDLFPLSFAQQQLWLLDQMHPQSALYNLPTAIRLSGALDLAALAWSLNAIVQRHEALRTTFITLARQPAQAIAETLRVPLLLCDLRALPPAACETAAQRLIEAEARAPFDLARGPLLRTSLLRLAATEHILLLTMHHIVADGWSIAVLMRELVTLYTSFAGGRAASLPPLPIQYADYASWQRERLQGELLATQLAYWRAQLADAPTVLELPADHPRPAIPTFRGAQQALSLSPSLIAALKAIGQRHETTLFMTLLAAFQTLLQRYTAQDRIVVGSPIANRTRHETAGLIGCFVNTVALYVDLAGNPSFTELLQRVRAVCLDAYTYADLPFEQVVEALQPTRSLEHAPLFQVMFGLQNTPLPQLELPGLTLRTLVAERATAKFDLLLDLEERADAVAGSIEYSTDLFDATTIARLVRHFATLLAGIAANPDQRLAALPLLTAVEQQQVIEWNATTAGYPGAASVYELFAAQAARTPDMIAGVFDGRWTMDDGRWTNSNDSPFSVQRSAFSVFQMTYRELNERANRLANHLRARGVGPDVLVGLYVERSLEMLVGILGILSAGGAYLPLDLNYPPERLAFILADAQVRVLVTATKDEGRKTNDEETQPESLHALGLTIDVMRASPPAIQNPKSKIQNADNLAYVIYTSGSTGVPKGVLVQQRGLLNLCYGLRAFFDDALVQATGLITSISFDISVNQIFPTLLFGRTLHIIPEELKLAGAAMLAYVATRRIQLLDGVPSYIQAVLADVAPQRVATVLRYLLIGGEPLERQLVRAVFAQLGRQVAIVNIYGLTEITDINAFAVIRAGAADRPITIGLPLQNNQLYLLDRYDHVQPIGVVGELCIAGASLARGYLGRPELTAERFVPNPFAGDTETRRHGDTEIGAAVAPQSAICNLQSAIGTRLCRTGDLGRRRADGTIELLGRRDQQVKLRGYRIELGEIEALLHQHAAVRAAVVVARADALGESQLVAYVVPAETLNAERRTMNGPERSSSAFSVQRLALAGELRAFLHTHLPDYMVPSAFVALAELPRTPSGKIDRRALPAPDWAGPRSDAGFVAPRMSIEEVIADIWATTLGVARVGIHDNFFALGGHSLRATQALARLRSALHVELPLRTLFEAPTVAELAVRVEQARQGLSAIDHDAETSGHRDTEIDKLFVSASPGLLQGPLSFAQQRFWFLQQLAPSSVAYLIAAAVRLDGRLVLAALGRSLNALVVRHTALRTCFTVEDGQPLQRIVPRLTLELPIVDLRALSPNEREAFARRLTAALTPFDLVHGPLLRATVLRLAEQEHILLIDVHHIAADGWSVDLIVRELSLLYAAFAAGQPLTLPELPIRYLDYAIWQREWLHGDTETRRHGDTETEDDDSASSHPQSPLQTQLAYWRTQLADRSALELPSDRPHQANPSFRAAQHRFVLPPALSAQLMTLSRATGTTLFMTMLAVFTTLLTRYSRQTDIIVGTPIANRTRPETQELIGCFINTLVLRTSAAGNPPFRELLRRVREVCLGAYAHQELPFEQLVEDLQPARDLGRNPLFDVLFELQNATRDLPELPGLRLRPFPIRRETAMFDLSLMIEEHAAGLRGALEYTTDRFDDATIQRMRAHFLTLLAGIVADPSRRIAELPLLSAAEQQQVYEWSAPTMGTPVVSPYVHELFAAQAERTPDAIALVYETNDERRTTNAADASFALRPSSFVVHMTYGALERRANQLAQYLLACGVRVETRVGLYTTRSLEQFVGLLGVLKAGGAYVPLDPSLPRERLAFIIADAQVSVLVTATKDEGRRTKDEGGVRPVVVRLSSFVGKVVDLHADWPLIAPECAADPAPAAIVNRKSKIVNPDNLAYVIYTSGSTGVPKGVLITHAALCNYTLATCADHALTPRDRLLQFAALSFDVSAEEIYPALARGATLVLRSERMLETPARFCRSCRDLALTVLNLPTAYWHTLVAELGHADVTLATTRLLIIGGERALPERLARWRAHAPQVRLVNTYGPTEATIGATTQVHAPLTFALPGREVAIGRAIRGARTYIVDRQMQPVPIGVAGELLIGGVGVARGYVGRPDLTAERFVPNPFAMANDVETQHIASLPTVQTQHIASLPTVQTQNLASLPHYHSSRLYRTGDLARYRPDGVIEFLGRSDDQVQVRGYRIELGEIEAALGQHPAVRDAVVLAREDTPGDTRLVAYVVTRNDDRRDAISCVSTNDLRAFLQERLPSYMLPAAFVFLDALPLTANGKVARRALPAPNQAIVRDDVSIAPRTPLEQVLAGIWGELLGQADIGVDDNFFALGGHSLLATQVISRIREALLLELPLRALFEAPTVGGLAAQVEHARQGLSAIDHDAETSRRADTEIDTLRVCVSPGLLQGPLSFAQQRFWFLQQLAPTSPAYNMTSAVQLSGRLSRVALAHSLNTVVARHAVLRTTFATADGQPVQLIAPTLTLRVPLLDLGDLTLPAREAQTLELAAAEARAPFDLAAGPLLRATLLRLAEQEHVLLVSMHHIVTDGWSIDVFVRELTICYQAHTSGQPVPLAELPLQYIDYAIWQREWLQGPLFDEQLRYWQGALDGFAALELPTDHARPATMVFRGARAALRLPKPLTSALTMLNQHMSVTLFMTLLAAFDIVLQRYSGQSDIIVGTPIANRTRSAVEGLIGPFINTLVLRSNLAGNPRFGELLRRVRAITLDAYANQDLPFEKLVERLQPDRDLSRAPIIQVVLNLLNTTPPLIELPGLALRALEIDNGTTKFDLTLFVEEAEPGLSLVAQYNTDLFEATTLARMLRHFQTVLAGAVADPDQRIASLPLLADAERQQLLVEWNATALPYPAGSIQMLFERQAARTPDAVAVVFGLQSSAFSLQPSAFSVQRSAFSLQRSAFSLQHLTYAELDRRANQLAQHLRRLDVGPESRVGLCLERSPELVIGLLGILKAGGAYVPLDPAYPAERLAFMLADAQVSVLIIYDLQLTIDDLEESQTSIVNRKSKIVNLKADWPQIAQLPAINPRVRVSADNLAYVIYTSGSTGVPKGVAVSHAGVGNLALAQIRLFALGPGSRVFQFVSFSFDGAVSDFVMTLLSGATLCLAPQAAALLGAGVLDLLRDYAITTMKLPPSLLAALPVERLPMLRTVVVAGESCSAELAARWGAGRQFFNIYGPSEVTVCATAGLFDDGPLPPHIGRPLPNKQLYLLDAQMQPVPLNVPGELYIGGLGLARGYLHRPDLTAERFVPNPWGSGFRVQGSGIITSDPRTPTLEPSSRLYRTGDRARYRPDGNLEFLGRTDEQVKLRGYRIELDEIAATLHQHPAVWQSVVIVREDVPGDRRLTAYVVPVETLNAERRTMNGPEWSSSAFSLQPSALAAELRAFLRARLPDYMIPAAFVLLDALPLTTNGKIDRRRLPAPGDDRPELEQPFVAPRTPVETLLAEIWSQTLGVKHVGAHDNFFELGGDSILSLQIVARANAIGLRLTPKQLFQHQTIAELSLVVDTLPALQVQQGLVTGALPLSPIQRRFFELDLPERQHWNQSLLVELRQPLRPELLAQALRQQLAHHDALRMRFARAESDAGWQQINADLDATVPFTRVDLAGLAVEQQPRAIESASAMLQASLDLACGPLLRVALFELGTQPGRLLIVVHHLVVDGVSWRILLEDLQTVYAQLSRAEAVRLPPKTTAFKHWAERQLAYARSDALHAERQFWLAEPPTSLVRLPLDYPAGRSVNTEASVRTLSVALDDGETSALLHDVPQVYHTQINDVLLTALAQTFARRVGPGTLLIDLEGQGREDLFDDVDLSRTVGWFTTVFPVRLRVDPNEHIGEQLKSIKEQLRSIPQHGIGYGMLRYGADADLVASLRALPQAEIGFNYLGQFDQVIAASTLFGLAQESSGPARSGASKRSHLLEINAMIVEGRLRLDWTYSSNIHRRARIEQLAQDFLEALRACIDHCLSPVAGGYTPSDFAEFQWSQTDLDIITRSIDKITGEA